MNVKTLNRILITGIAAFAVFTGNMAAQTVIVGTGDPDIDIAAVQAAVDRGGSVVLRGHFSFDNPPIRRGALPDLVAIILVSKEVTISGTWDEHGEMTAIDGGEIPFAVEVSRGTTSTDADAVYLSRHGIATALVSVPLRYMHSPVEIVDLEDIERAVQLIVAFAMKLDSGLDLAG